MNLFNQKLLRDRIARFNFPTGEKAAEQQKVIANWQFALKERDLARTKEKSIQGQFLTKFFCEILGYAMQTGSEREWNLTQHPTTEVDAQEADGSLGFFTKETKITKAVIELKDAKASLDKKQSGREKGYTPIEQGYLYATKFDRCSWIIISNFREIRLYNKNRTQDYCEKFDVLELHKEEEFKRFYYILCKQNLISTAATSTIDDLADISSKEDENITLKFYKDYKNIRLNVFNHLIQHNPAIEKTILLEKAQKILDRLIFILFCEDTGNLLPRNLVRDTYSHGIRSRERSDQRVWREFKNLFMDIDQGRSDIDPHINEYNGGLFAADEILDTLTIKDAIWKELVDLNRYDFESELNVNILGHIFEQSISDLEALRTAIQPNGKEEELKTTDNKNGKRKKDGIFYTPEFITKYIVDRAIGKFLEENPDKLETMKILDPACGSGAFLNQAHNYLMREYKSRAEERLLEKSGIQQLDFSYINLAEQNRSILLNNLFGVDLNQESIEITKLSLWLKTASASEPLQNLDKNIKCGNSIVDNPFYAGDKAFQWKEEFQEIMATGGFDVIIGNPPYVRQEILKEIKPYLERTYTVYSGVSDLYVYFFEKALSLLKENGYFSFIVSNKFLRAEYGKKLTQYLQKSFTILEIIDFGDLQIFEGATTYPCIITIQKKKPLDIQRVPLLKLTTLDSISNLELALKENNQTIEIRNNDTTWQLRSIEQTTLLQKITDGNTTLGQFIYDKIFYGIKIGFNEAFIINNATKEDICKADAKNTEFIKPLLIGKEINRYEYTWEGLWAIVIPTGWTNSNRGEEDPETFFKSALPTIYSHLKSVQERFNSNGSKPRGKGLYERDDKGDYWWELRPCAYYNSFSLPKIIWGNLATTASFTYDTDNYYVCAPACIIPTNEKWLVGLLNSSIASFFLKTTAIERQGGFIEQKPIYVKQMPVPSINEAQKTALETNVERIMTLQRELYKQIERSLELIKSEYGLKKTNSRIENFYELGWNELNEELEKQKIKLDLKRKDELNEWFRSKKAIIKNIQGEIDLLNTEINNIVFDAFHLTNEERVIVNNFK